MYTWHFIFVINKKLWEPHLFVICWFWISVTWLKLVCLCVVRFSLWNTMMGTSLLSMPWAIQQVCRLSHTILVAQLNIELQEIFWSVCCQCQHPCLYLLHSYEVMNSSFNGFNDTALKLYTLASKAKYIY